MTSCPECGKSPLVVQGAYGPVSVDACFGGLIEGCISACCGHGGRKPAYVRLHVGDGRYIDICGGVIVPYRDFVATTAQDQDERVVLGAEERARFVAYLRQDADQEAGLVEFLGDLPAGTNGARIRTDCKIRRDVKRALAEEIERGR